MKEVCMIFDELFEKLPHLNFDPSWENGTGYFDGAYDVEGLQGKAMDPHGRRLLILQLPGNDGNLSTAVWNERFTHGELLVLGNAHRFLLSALETYNPGMKTDQFGVAAEAARLIRNHVLKEPQDMKDILKVMKEYFNFNYKNISEEEFESHLQDWKI